MKNLIVSLAAAALSAVWSLPAVANPYAEHLQARLVPGWTNADGTLTAGLELTLSPGWKTYWRMPGSAGIPPNFDWSKSENLADLHIVWPQPQVFDLSGMRSIGYHGKVVLPLRIKPAHTGQPVDLKGEIQLGICDSVCVPLTVDVSADLSPDRSKRVPEIAAALASSPYTAAEGKVSKATCRFTPNADGISIEARLKMPSAGGDEVTVFETHAPDVMMSDSKSHREGDTLISKAEMLTARPGVYLNRSNLKITVLGSNYSVEIDGCKAG